MKAFNYVWWMNFLISKRINCRILIYNILNILYRETSREFSFFCISSEIVTDSPVKYCNNVNKVLKLAEEDNNTTIFSCTLIVLLIMY